MKLAGRVNGMGEKDFGKGKDAEARICHVVKIRLDRRGDLPAGYAEIPITDDEYKSGELFCYGGQVSGALQQSQPGPSLDLNARAVARREKDRAAAGH